MLITVGRAQVKFTLRRDEVIYQDTHSGAWIANYLGLKEEDGARRWERLGTYGSREAAAKALYLARSEFSAAYG